MADYKKSNEHLANSCLAVPVLLATGNIGVAITAVGLGKLLDIIDDQNYEEGRKEWEKNPHRVVQLTEKEKEKYWKDHKLAKKIIKENKKTFVLISSITFPSWLWTNSVRMLYLKAA